MSADDIQKAKMHALFMQIKHGKTGLSSNRNTGMKNGPSSMSPSFSPVSKIHIQPKIEEYKKPVIPPLEVSCKVEGSLNPKKEIDSKEPVGEVCSEVKIPWKSPPGTLNPLFLPLSSPPLNSLFVPSFVTSYPTTPNPPLPDDPISPLPQPDPPYHAPLPDIAEGTDTSTNHLLSNTSLPTISTASPNHVSSFHSASDLPLPQPSSRMLTKSQTGHFKPRTFHDYHLHYTTRHPFRALHAGVGGTIYQVVQGLPSNPKEPWDLEMDYDDTLTPEIPIEQPPDADGSEIQVSLTEHVSTVVAPAPAPSVPQVGGGSGTKPDLELLVVLQENPELVFALTSGQARNLSSEETVKLFDMIKAGGAGLAGSLNGLGGKVEKVEVSLPSPTPSCNPGTERDFGQYCKLSNKSLNCVNFL
ncbi:hypothetical protein SADUNF_Sadunf14G0099300 [Salix dunnii]|uniref:Uncharacterized protein n=1 Tax=Salix dunnii TaxID=1413687 RepID=A0A835JGP3_9ROSI|nr:hypothetical protein SADUNF_Sadunf14G0099300 [Salix dunnii]